MQLEVVQWNVWYKQNIEDVVRVLRPLNADIICLQELTHGYIKQSQENTWEYIQHQLGLNCVVQEIPIITESAQWTQANAIFSKFPLTENATRWLHVPKHEDDLSDQYRGYLEASVHLGDLVLDVATTHPSFGVHGAQDEERDKLEAIVAAKSHRYLIATDLNDTPGSERVTMLERHLRHAGPPYDQKTWTTKPYNFGGREVNTLDWRYDFIFTTPDIEVVEAKILDTDVSDHLPVMATLKVG
jgi:endonuclease/exonuclease/phosphatase family metal-dependent hydrolase